MLVITRKLGESLMVGNEIEIKILAVDQDQVRIGIEAPREVPVHRREVFTAIIRQNLAAVKSGIPSKELISALQGASRPSDRQPRRRQSRRPT